MSYRGIDGPHRQQIDVAMFGGDAVTASRLGKSYYIPAAVAEAILMGQQSSDAGHK